MIKHVDYPLNPGGSVEVIESETDEFHLLDLEKIKEGLQLMANKYPRHFADLLEGNFDVKATYLMLASTQGAEMRNRAGLQAALEHMGIGFDGRCGAPHRALADAYNTYRAYMYLSTMLKSGFLAAKYRI